jgi:hypothetical protein
MYSRSLTPTQHPCHPLCSRPAHSCFPPRRYLTHPHTIYPPPVLPTHTPHSLEVAPGQARCDATSPPRSPSCRVPDSLALTLKDVAHDDQGSQTPKAGTGDPGTNGYACDTEHPAQRDAWLHVQIPPMYSRSLTNQTRLPPSAITACCLQLSGTLPPPHTPTHPTHTLTIHLRSTQDRPGVMNQSTPGAQLVAARPHRPWL